MQNFKMVMDSDSEMEYNLSIAHLKSPESYERDMNFIFLMASNLIKVYFHYLFHKIIWYLFILIFSKNINFSRANVFSGTRLTISETLLLINVKNHIQGLQVY